jgi:hypothetical protein
MPRRSLWSKNGSISISRPRAPGGFVTSTAIHQAIKAGKVPPARRTLSQMPLHIHTRLSMLSRVVRRLNQECEALYESVKKHGPEHVSWAGHKAFVFPVDEDLKYCLLADIDSFIFEIDACLDLFINLNQMVHNHIWENINRDESRKLLKNAAAAAGQGNGDPRWFHDLDRARNILEFIPIKPSVARVSNARERDATHSRFP